MAIPLNDNTRVLAPKPTDPRYFADDNMPWDSIVALNAGLPSGERHEGLTVNIAGVEYWWKDGAWELKEIGGKQCIIVSSHGTDLENGITLQNAYNDAKTRTPSATNVITIVATAGTYKFPSAGFLMDTEYINLVSIDGNRSVVFDIDVADPYDYDFTNNVIISKGECLTISANNIFVKGIVGKTRTSANYFTYTGISEYVLPIITGNFANIEVHNCVGGIYSFSSNIGASAGVYNNCVGGTYSFAGDLGTASGVYNDCIGGDYSFGGNYGTASGIFNNCTGGGGSFGGFGGVASGAFNYCTGDGDYSFGGNNTASGTFNYCVGGSYGSFGGFGGTASGTFNNCKCGGGSFGGDNGIASGTFTNCVGGGASFAGGGGIASGTFNYCISGIFSFGGNSGEASGIFNNCLGEFGSFGGSGGTISATGRLYYCRLTGGTFSTVSSGGRTVYCIDGNNNTNNQ